jgi:hypothetical protein
VIEPGTFDVANSFFDQKKQASLHLLARVDRPKAPAKKGTPPTENAPRGDFTTDVLDLIKTAYGSDIDAAKLKSETKSHGRKSNTYKTLTFEVGPKEVKVFFFGEKASPDKVALIFDYPKTEAGSLSSRINLCLESFGVGEEARRAFAGIVDEESTEETAQPAVF